MAGLLSRAVVKLGSLLRDVGVALSAVMPSLRSSDGTYGTQRMYAKQRDAERRDTYPSD